MMVNIWVTGDKGAEWSGVERKENRTQNRALWHAEEKIGS